MDVTAFQHRVRSDLAGLVAELQDETGRWNPDEAWAWEGSLPKLATALGHPALKRFHVHLGRRGSISLEYRLPAAASWVDAAVVGRTEERPAAVLVEMKDWSTAGDQPGPRPGLIVHQGTPRLHPAEQVRGYVEYCRKFHSAVQERSARVDGCAFLTGTLAAPAHTAPPHDVLTREYPVFTAHQTDLSGRLPEFLAALLTEPDPDFAEEFEEGRYRQERSFVVQVAKAIEEPGSSPFVLLDGQREGFEHCLRNIDEVLGTSTHSEGSEKAVVIIEGPPGSGKSVLAAHLWSHLVMDERIDGNVVLTTTSASQKSNWANLFERTSDNIAARGLVKPANQYNPGITGAWVKKQRELGHRLDAASWKENLALFRRSGARNRCPDDSFAVSIVDEAHALVDPSVPGTPLDQGWGMHAGPQAWHIMRSSRISIFLLDGEQSFRDVETTTTKRILELADDLGIRRIGRVSLAGAQFRCGGSTEYMAWLDRLLDLGSDQPTTARWRTTNGGPFHFEIVDDPGALDEHLAAQIDRGFSARLLASYARPWHTRNETSPWDLPPRDQDFCIHYERDAQTYTWHRPWNYTPRGTDYTLFIQAPEGSRMAGDLLCEVGCPYVVRGFDYDYLGILWLGDLLWRGRWTVDLSQVHETAWRSTLGAARREKGDGPATRELLRRLLRGYRILLSRAIRGVYVWFEDAETRDYVDNALARP